ncbi:MAG: hypothetical protein ACK5KM_05025 [Hyphomicrobiaceae bacterium]
MKQTRFQSGRLWRMSLIAVLTALSMVCAPASALAMQIFVETLT